MSGLDAIVAREIANGLILVGVSTLILLAIIAGAVISDARATETAALVLPLRSELLVATRQPAYVASGAPSPTQPAAQVPPPFPFDASRR